MAVLSEPVAIFALIGLKNIRIVYFTSIESDGELKEKVRAQRRTNRACPGFDFLCNIIEYEIKRNRKF